MANEETVTKVVEGVDRLFDEIVVNGRTVKSAPARQSAGSSPVSTNRSEPPIQGEYVEAIQLNNILHDIKDTPLTQEVLAIQQAINTLQGRLNDLITSVGDINSKIPAQASSTNQLADKDFVNSGLNNINVKIPAQASAQNQLADKNFVNSSIATNTANFLGTYSTLAEIEAIPNPTNNDYAFLETADASGNNLYDRYKYSEEDGEWLFEYELNNSSFTAEQWATINSGLTSTSVSDAIGALDASSVGGNNKYIKAISETDGVISATEGTVDTTVTQNSDNLVTSGAVYDAIAQGGGGDDWATTKQNIADELGLTASQYNGNSATATTAYKIRTSAPSSPSDGDIWLV